MSKSIVMIHGMWGGGWCWENFKQYFEQKGYACHAPTLRYHDMEPGDSPNASLGVVSLKEYARDLERYIRCMGVKPILMGHSMGGLLAQMLAAKGLAQGFILAV